MRRSKNNFVALVDNVIPSSMAQRPKVSVKSAGASFDPLFIVYEAPPIDMLDEWQIEALELTLEALKKSTVDRDVAETVKKEFDRRVRLATRNTADDA